MSLQKIKSNISTFLRLIFYSKKNYYFLIAINLIVGVLIFSISCKAYFPDSLGYWLMAKSMFLGKYSSWYTLDTYYPETLRTPGYPIFLAMCQLVSDSTFLPKFLQLLIYFSIVYLCIKIIEKINPNIVYKNIFLFILIPNVQIVYYTGLISAEILNTFFVILSMYLLVLKRSSINVILLAFSCYAAFIIRPSFLLFPFVMFVYLVISNKKDLLKAILFIVAYVALLIPFGMWNKMNHGIFKITTIDGAAGAMHMGYWALKLPDGYTEPFYWGHNTEYDLTRPHFYTKDQELENVKIYEKECSEIWNTAKKYESIEDSLNIVEMKKNTKIFVIHNSKYTIEREKLLMKANIRNILNDPVYIVKSKIYEFVRFYVTGINYKKLKNCNTLSDYVNTIYPTLVTLIFIFFGLIYTTVLILFKRVRFKYALCFILLFWYYGVMHLPFSIQARYTIPIHLLILSIISISILRNKTVNE